MRLKLSDGYLQHRLYTNTKDVGHLDVVKAPTRWALLQFSSRHASILIGPLTLYLQNALKAVQTTFVIPADVQLEFYTKYGGFDTLVTADAWSMVIGTITLIHIVAPKAASPSKPSPPAAEISSGLALPTPLVCIPILSGNHNGDSSVIDPNLWI